MKLFQNNIAVLKKRFPSVHEQVVDSVGDSIEVVETKQGDFVPAIIKNGVRLLVHSKFDPVREAERFIGELDLGAHDLFIVFGFGFGYHVEQIRKGMGKDSLVLVIEKNPLLLKRAMEARDISATLGDERFILLLNPPEDAIAEALRGKSSRRSSLILHRGSFQIDPDYYGNMQEIVRSYLSTKEVNIATLAKFERIWASNIARNIDAFIRAPGANIFFNMFRNMPAIVAAAGPSLIRSIDFIRRSRGRAIIVAVDTSYRILMKHGIEPHFCIVVDPQVINARYFEGSGRSRTILIADPTVHPSVFRLFGGRVAMTGIAFELMKWIGRQCGDKGEITHGGSVSTNAYDFAKRLGASPVILVGQDLAFTGGLAHARGSYLDEQVHLRTGRLYTPEMFNRFQLTALPKILVEGIGGGQAHTNQKMMIFLSWFEKRRDGNLINATEDGASIPGVKHVKSDEIEMPEPKTAFDAEIEEIYRKNFSSGAALDAGARLLRMIGSILKEIDSILPVLDRAVGFSENLETLMKEKKREGGQGPDQVRHPAAVGTSASVPQRDQNKLNYLLNKLAEADRIVESKKHAKEMISFTIQRVIHTINEGYEIDEGDSALSDSELVAKRSSYLYKGLLEGARFNVRILKKMEEVLQYRGNESVP
jgi:hypothetical protein